MGVVGTNCERFIDNRLQKDTADLVRGVEKSFDNQVRIIYNDSDCLDVFNLEIAPNSGFYHGGTFLFKVVVDDKYPLTAPSLTCLTDIYHPNINCFTMPFDDYEHEDDNVCLSILEDWQPRSTLCDLAQGILYLFFQPNLADILSPIVACDESEKDFTAKVKKSLRGGLVEGAVFKRNLPENWPLGEADEGPKSEVYERRLLAVLEKRDQTNCKQKIEDDAITKL